MSRYIIQAFRHVVGACNNFIAAHYNGTNRHLVYFQCFLRFFQRFAHVMFVVDFDIHPARNYFPKFSHHSPLTPKGESTLHNAGRGSPFRESEGSKGQNASSFTNYSAWTAVLPYSSASYF